MVMVVVGMSRSGGTARRAVVSRVWSLLNQVNRLASDVVLGQLLVVGEHLAAEYQAL